MTLATDEFIRRFLLHVLPKGFHRIRHYGLLSGAGRQANLALARQLPGVAPIAPTPMPEIEPAASPEPRWPCSCCGGRMIVLEILAGMAQPRGPPASSAFSRETSA